MSADCVFVVACLAGASVIGLPVAAFLPRNTFRHRLLAAPPLGLAAFGVIVTSLYAWGVAPGVGGLAALGAGLLGCVATARRWRPDVEVRSALGVAASLSILTLATLTPAWVGGSAFTAFQGNPYDMLNYEGMAYSYAAHPFADIAAMVPGDALSRTGSFALDAKTELGIRPAVSIVLAAIYRPFFTSTVDAAYPYMAALLSLTWFSIALLVAECFGASLLVGGGVAFCFVAGFFGQYVMDIDAWGQIAGTAPAVAVLAIFARYATADTARAGWPDHAGPAAVVAVLVGGLLYLYPEITTVYAVAVGASAVAVLAGSFRLATIGRLATMAAGALGGLALCFPFVSGTLGSLVLQTRGGPVPENWVTFFDAYVYGVPFPGAATAAEILADAAYVADGLAGVYFLVPVLPPVAGGLFALALVACAAAAAWTLRRRPGVVAMVTGSCAALGVALALFALHRPWEAGKAFSMASPLWLALLALPLSRIWQGCVGEPTKPCSAAPRRAGWLLGSPALLLLAAHAVFGVDRVVVAMRPDGIGRHAPYPTMVATKRSFVVDPSAWRASLAGCRGVTLSVDDRVLDRLAQIVLAQQTVPWSSRTEIRGSFTHDEHIGMMPQVRDADCTMTDAQAVSGPGRVISLRRPPAALGTMAYAGTPTEMAASDAPGIDVSGMFAAEAIPNGFARWTNGAGHAYITVPPGREPNVLTMALGIVAPVGDVTVKLNGTTLYAGPQWTGPRDIAIPADTAPGPWTFDILSDTWSAPGDPRRLGIYLTGLVLHRTGD